MRPTTKLFELLSEVSSRGVTLRLKEGALHYDGPQADLTFETRTSLERSREELAALLREGGRASFPLSYGQRALWFLHQVAPESSAYHVKFAGRVYSEVDRRALRGAFQTLIARHPMLRTTFSACHGVPVQRVHEHQDIWFEEIDASRWTWEELTVRVHEAFKRPFDLERGPLLRVQLFSRLAREHVLLLTIHHLVADRWSMWVLARELQALYAAETLGLPVPSLPPLALTYANYVSWQDELVSGPAGERLWQYWKARLAGDLAPLGLPTDRARPAVQTFRGASHEIDLTSALTTRLRNLARAEGVTLYMVLLAAFQLLLHRHSGQEDILVGSPTAGRSQSLLADVVGYFVNPVVLRADLSGNPTFRALLAQVRERTVEALRYQDFPFPLLVERLRPKRDPSRSPLFQAVFSMGFLSQHAGVPELDLPRSGSARVNFGGLEIGSFDLEHQEGQFDLNLDIMPTQGTLAAKFRYSTDLFTDETIARMAGHYHEILRSVEQDPDQRIGRVNLLTTGERERLLRRWNVAARDRPGGSPIHTMFERHAAERPAQTAALCSGEAITYGTLNARANQLARYLVKRGFGHGALIGVYLSRSLDMLVAVLGILKAGSAYVPIDPDYPMARVAYMLGDAQAGTVLSEQALLRALPEHEGRQVLCLDREWCRIAGEHSANLDLPVSPDHRAYVIYTSGSTGTPKGVEVLHRGLVNVLEDLAECTGFAQDDKVLSVATLAYDAAAFELFLGLIKGGHVEIVPREVAADGIRLRAVLDSRPPRLMLATPTMWRMLIDVGWTGNRGLTICSGGEALPYTLKERLLARGREVWNLYGPTESTIIATRGAMQPGKTVTIGRPVANTQVYILNDDGAPVPIGVTGSLYVGGEGVAKGYLGRPELTRQRFIADPFSQEPGARLYSTGDLARWLPQGEIEFLGRRDHQVKVRGHRVELGEVEAVLGQYGGIRACVVVCRETAPLDKRLVAYVVPEGCSNPSVAALRDFLRDRLPEPMVPSVFVVLDALPLSPHGKVDRLALPEPADVEVQHDRGHEPPRSPTEEVLAGIWAELLGVDRVGIRDSFFDVGGHSLLVIQLILRVKDVFGVEVPVRRILELPTIASMAQAIDALRRGETSDETLPGVGVDLEEEAILEPDIRPPRGRGPNHREPRAILLTGATGFLGGYLLKALAQQTSASLYCLVPGQNEEQAWAGLRGALQSSGLWTEIDRTRVQAVAGDLSKPRVALSDETFERLAREIDVIYHADAMVKLTYPYSALKPTNVDGTRWILRLATHKRAIPVHYVSTLLIFASASYFDGGIIYESDDLKDSHHRFIPYADSRWVSEKLVRAAGELGLPTTVYRIGHLVGDSRSGVWRPDDHLARMIKGCLQLGKWPEIQILVQPTPVDFLSHAIVNLARQPDSAGKVFHVANPTIVTTNDLYEWVRSLGYEVELVPLPEWRAALLATLARPGENALASLAPLLMENVATGSSLSLPEMFVPPRRPHIDCREAERALGRLSIPWPTIDASWLRRCMGYFARSGYVDAPPRGASRADGARTW